MACLWNQGAYSCLTILLNLPVAEEVNNGFEKKHKSTGKLDAIQKVLTGVHVVQIVKIVVLNLN